MSGQYGAVTPLLPPPPEFDEEADTSPDVLYPVERLTRRPPRHRTEDVNGALTKRDLELGRAMYPTPRGIERPETRGDCLPGGSNEERPCPFVSCKHHLYLDVKERTGAITMNFPHLEVDEMGESCSLDVADEGGATLAVVAEAMNVTREWARQIEIAPRKRLILALGQYRGGK